MNRDQAMGGEPSLRILLVDDEDIIHQTIGDYLRDCGYAVDRADDGNAALELIETHEYRLALADLRMPGLDGMALLQKAKEVQPLMPVVIITGHGTMETVIEALRLGAADFLPKPIRLLELDAVLEKCTNLRALRREKRHLRETIRGLQASRFLSAGLTGFVGESAAACRVRDQISEAVAAECDTILIEGETGTGKEVVARAIHRQACSDDAPFIAVSCPALPESLVVSELFGHVKGTFTGATQDRPGYFELAHGGTLFLDEVADLSAAAQATLLRVLETRTLRRVGGAEEVAVNVRVITATNVELAHLVEQGRFRRDLYYRLNVYTIPIPPLRERADDVVPLAEHFLASYAKPRSFQFEGFSTEAQQLLRCYAFPGNARELRNIVERAAILARQGTIGASQLHVPQPAPGSTSPPAGGAAGSERDRILAALEQTKWNRRQAAQLLGMAYSTLRYKLKSLDIT